MKVFSGAVLALLMLASVPSHAAADTIYVTDNLTYPFGTNATGGGPYVASTSGSLLGSRTFVTFGLEYSEPLTLGATYDFVLSDNAFHGGVNGAVGDPVQNKTKWLYYQVASGAYTTWGSGSPAITAGFGSSVQQAIWYFEGERRQNQIDAGATALVDYVTGRFSDWTVLEAQGHHVFALNLMSPVGCVGTACTQNMDQLAYAYVSPVPEPASMILFGSGLAAVAGLARRRRRR